MAILYVIIIALAGLGIVVVKALGGEDVPMAAGTTLTLPGDATINKTYTRLTDQTAYRIPPGSSYRFGKAKGRLAHVPRGIFQLVVAPGLNSMRPANGVEPEWSCRRTPDALRAGQLVGDVHDRLHDPDRALRRLLHVQGPQGESRRGVDPGCGRAVLAATVAGAMDSRVSTWERYFSLSREQTIYAIAAYGFVASVLPVWLLLCSRAITYRRS